MKNTMNSTHTQMKFVIVGLPHSAQLVSIRYIVLLVVGEQEESAQAFS
jgi:hypothetical protein